MNLSEIDAEQKLPIRDRIIAIITRDPISAAGDRIFAEDLMDEYDAWRELHL